MSKTSDCPQSRCSKVYIRGSWGTLTVDSVTGNVLSYDNEGNIPDNDEVDYSDIVRIDLQEHMTFWKLEVPPTDGDILDFGFWTNIETYEPPIAEWRENYRK